MNLTARMQETLLSLRGCTAPWDAQARSNRVMLSKLERAGFATWQAADWRTGRPTGWIITDAGRAALSGDKP